jgi:probable AcnD-accessory protein PrpF
MPQLRIPAVYMRGGTSKGVFFHATALPADPAARDALLLRVIGSPDPYGKQIDGMGGASSSTSKVVLLSPSNRTDSDVDYLFGQVAIDAPLIDWSGNCGNLSAAVGPFAISEGLVDAPRDGIATVRIWQANLRKHIVAHVPVRNGEVVEDGGFELDGVTFPAAEIRLEFMDPGATEDESGAGGMFPTGRVVQAIETQDRACEVTLINAGNPTVFVDARSLGLTGTEMQGPFNSDEALLARCERLRARAAVIMGIASSDDEAARLRQHTPKLIFVAPPVAYTTSRGREVNAADIEILARAISMGKLHHAMTGTGAIAIAVAANIPGTVVHRLLDPQRLAADTGNIRFGHPSGVLQVGASARRDDNGRWIVDKVSMSRSARRLMEGYVRVPSPATHAEGDSSC